MNPSQWLGRSECLSRLSSVLAPERAISLRLEALDEWFRAVGHPRGATVIRSPSSVGGAREVEGVRLHGEPQVRLCDGIGGNS